MTPSSLVSFEFWLNELVARRANAEGKEDGKRRVGFNSAVQMRCLPPKYLAGHPRWRESTSPDSNRHPLNSFDDDLTVIEPR